MVFIDILLGLLLLWGLFKGLKNGFIIELASLIALIAGLYGAFHFSGIAADHLSPYLDWNRVYINLTAFILTFILIVVLVQLLGNVLTGIVNLAMLGLLNKLAGAFFGILKVAVILGALLLFLENANFSLGLIKPEKTEESILYGPLRELGALLFSKVAAWREAAPSS